MNPIQLKVFISGPLPGRNEQEAAARKHRQTAAKMKKEWTLHCERCFTGSGKHFQRVSVHFEWHEPNRRRDPDNISAAQKFVLDGMVKAGVIPNDGWKNIKGLTHSWVLDKEWPGVHVLIEEA